MSRCQQCGGQLGLADPQMVRRWISLTTGNSQLIGERLTTACPACDAYTLGAELENPLPFYSDAIAAFVTVNDWDWWNRDAADCDIRGWPDFGCLTFSEGAIRSAVKFVREAETSLIASETPLPLQPSLIGPTGMPEDENPTAEWENQLNILHSRMRGEYSSRELDVAIRRLIAVLA